MEDKIIEEDKKYSKCYWDNLNRITIINFHKWKELNYREEWKNKVEITIVKIFRKNDGKWYIYKDNPLIPNEKDINKDYNLREEIRVPDWVFPKAFKDIYIEMEIQFKMNDNRKGLKRLKALFKA